MSSETVSDERNTGWLIHKAGRGWYRPNAQGYTNDIEQAGRYSHADALSYSHPNGWDGPRDGITIKHESELQSLRSKPVASGVEVKPLEWSGVIPGRIFADIYMIERLELDDWRLFLRANEHGDWPRFLAGPFSLEEAKAAAEADYRNRILSALAPATAPVVSEPVAWKREYADPYYQSEVTQWKETADVWAEDGFTVTPLFPSPQLQPKAVTEELDGADLQTLMQLKRDNVWDGARPVLENPIADEMRRAFALSERGLIALEQVARGVRLHITRKGVAALEAAMKEA